MFHSRDLLKVKISRPVLPVLRSSEELVLGFRVVGTLIHLSCDSFPRSHESIIIVSEILVIPVVPMEVLTGNVVFIVEGVDVLDCEFKVV